jgi:membrane fusion protein (multidrug efflux system)
MHRKSIQPRTPVGQPFQPEGIKWILSKNTMKRSVFRASVFPVIVLTLISVCLPSCKPQQVEQLREVHKIVVSTPEAKPVSLTRKYVCQIHSKRHIKVRALDRGYLEEISVREGQSVKQGDVLFKVVPAIYQAKLDAELAARELAQMQYDYSKKLTEEKVVSTNELSLKKAELARAQANVNLAQAQLNFATVKAPFDGIIDRLLEQLGSLVEEGDTLTTLSDNSLMWVYFNVPEESYLDYMTELSQQEKNLKIELLLANHKKFSQIGKIGAVEAEFNNRTGNIPFRADFPNPDGLLRNGQTGTVLIGRVQQNAIVIPQRATFQVLDKRYVYVVDKEQVAHQREIEVENELDDVFIIKAGLTVNDKFIVEGGREVHDGDKVEFEEQKPAQVFANLKFHAE